MLHEYHVIYSVRYYPWFHVTAGNRGRSCDVSPVNAGTHLYIFPRESLVTTVNLINSVEYNHCCEAKVVKIYTPRGRGAFTQHSVSLPWSYVPATGLQMKPVHALKNVCPLPHKNFRLAFVPVLLPSHLHIHYASGFATDVLS
jgi:hypothetical protein